MTRGLLLGDEQAMEAGGVPTNGAASIASALHDADVATYPAYEALKVGKVALGGSPIHLGASLTTHALGAVMDPKQSSAIHHLGWATDGLVHGLLYKRGLLHSRAAAVAPWLVNSRPHPAGLGKLAGAVGQASHFARIGLLGVGGAMGAARAVSAVTEGGGGALLSTREGRGGMLQAVGSALLLVKHPATYLAGAAAFALAFVNDLA